MADGEGENPRERRQDDRNGSNNRSGHRHHEENPADVRTSRDHSQPITTRTQLMSLSDTGVDSHAPMNVDITQRTGNGQVQSGQTVQSHGNSVSGTDQQLATGSCVHNLNKGPTQFGETNIVNNYITNNNNNNHNHYHYHCSHQPPHYHGNIPQHHDPYHCAPCLDYHNNDHTPVAEQHRPQPETQPQHPQLPHQSLPQLPASEQRHPQPETQPRHPQLPHQSLHQLPASEQRHPQPETQPRQQQLPHQLLPRLPPSEEQTEHAESSTQRDQMLRPQNETGGQRVKATGQTVPATDVTDNVTLAEKRAKKSAKPAVASNEVPKPQTSRGVCRSSERRQVSDDEVVDNLTIIDSKGRSLMPGDVVFCSVGFAIYTGNQRIVWCEQTGEVVKSETLNMTQTFQKCRITSGECRVFPPQDRVERSMSRVGTRLTEVDGWWWYGLDFTYWVLTGLDFSQAYSRGFDLGGY